MDFEELIDMAPGQWIAFAVIAAAIAMGFYFVELDCEGFFCSQVYFTIVQLICIIMAFWMIRYNISFKR